MSEPVIPYASVERRGLTARDIFGVVVRSFGVLVLLWAAYTLVFLLNAKLLETQNSHHPAGTYLLMVLAYGAVGLALLRGEWIVQIAYGPAPAHS